MSSTIEAVIDSSHALEATLENRELLTAELESPKQVMDKDYENLKNKPSINDVMLSGNKTFEELGDHILTNSEILNLYKTVKGM